MTSTVYSRPDHARLRLAGNLRVAILWFVLAGLITVAGVWAVLANLPSLGIMGAVTALVLPIDLLLLTLAWFAAGPRLRIGHQELIVWLRYWQTDSIPLDVVECFFLGHKPVPRAGHANEQTEARHVVVRLAERAQDWHRREMPPTVGQWCDGYISISGLWCEPISGEQLSQLNASLSKAQRRFHAR